MKNALARGLRMASPNQSSLLTRRQIELLRKFGALVFVLVALSFVSAEPALAQGTTGIDTMAQNILAFLQGTFAKTVATIAVIVVGIMFWTGRAGLALLVTTIVGMFIVFSAGWIVNTITGA